MRIIGTSDLERRKKHRARRQFLFTGSVRTLPLWQSSVQVPCEKADDHHSDDQHDIGFYLRNIHQRDGEQQSSLLDLVPSSRTGGRAMVDRQHTPCLLYTIHGCGSKPMIVTILG